MKECGRQLALPDPFAVLDTRDTAVRQLEAYSYPLNISELKTMVERAAAQAGSGAGGMGRDGAGTRVHALCRGGACSGGRPEERAAEPGACAACMVPPCAPPICHRLQSSPDAGNKINEEVFWFAKQVRKQAATPFCGSEPF